MAWIICHIPIVIYVNRVICQPSRFNQIQHQHLHRNQGGPTALRLGGRAYPISDSEQCAMQCGLGVCNGWAGRDGRAIALGWATDALNGGAGRLGWAWVMEAPSDLKSTSIEARPNGRASPLLGDSR